MNDSLDPRWLAIEKARITMKTADLIALHHEQARLPYRVTRRYVELAVQRALDDFETRLLGEKGEQP